MTSQEEPLSTTQVKNEVDTETESDNVDASASPPACSHPSSPSSSSQQQQSQQQRPNNNNNNINNNKKKRHGARNQHRHKDFVKWIMDTFYNPKSPIVIDKDTNNNNRRHILDVAGGKGEVAARLTMCHVKNVIMVDPRPADVVHCFETLVLPKIPNKWQRRLEEQRKDDPDFVRKTLQSRFTQLVTTFEDYNNNTADVQEAIQGAGLILGLHADSATEAIVDIALQHETPFVVVPCCVFPNFFKERRLRNDKDGSTVPVRSHEQFCEYLKQKDSRFRMETLPFEGRNVAIWWDGK